MKRLGLEIRYRRLNKNMTQGELAESCGMGVATIRRIEEGKTDFCISSLLKIEEALNCKGELLEYIYKED